MKKHNIILGILVIVLALGFTGCKEEKTVASQTATEQATAEKIPENNTIRLGINGDDSGLWKYMTEELAKENVKLELVTFSDYIIPNTALSEGEIDANAFQTEIFFQNYVEQSGSDLSSLGYTLLAPMGIYPGTVDTIEAVPDNSKIAIPTDLSNGGRALILLDAAGLIEIDESKGLLPTLEDIKSNPKNLEIVQLVPTQIPTSISEFSVACINNNIARDAGLSPLDDAIFLEDTKEDYVKAYYNIIAVQTKDLEDPRMKKLIEVYHRDRTKDVINEVYKGSAIPAF